MSEPAGKITIPSAQELGRMIQVERGRYQAHGGEGRDRGLGSGAPIFLVQATTGTVAPGTTGGFTVYGGTKGLEAAGNLAFNGFTRYQPMIADEGQFGLAVPLDQGYEIIPLNLFQQPGSNSNQPCTNCTNCVTENLVTDCSAVNPIAGYWTFSLGPTPGTCCTGGLQANRSFALAWTSGCTWQSAPFSCSGQQLTWTMTVAADYVTLTLTLPNSSSGSPQSIVYKAATGLFSGLCPNTLQLVLTQANQLPSGCVPPCTICLAPANTLYCQQCVTGPGNLGVEFASSIWTPAPCETIPGEALSTEPCGSREGQPPYTVSAVSLALSGSGAGTCCSWDPVTLTLTGANECCQTTGPTVSLLSCPQGNDWTLTVVGNNGSGGSTSATWTCPAPSLCTSGSASMQPASGNPASSPYNQPVTVSWINTAI
jgi:hypothetical protein